MLFGILNTIFMVPLAAQFGFKQTVLHALVVSMDYVQQNAIALNNLFGNYASSYFIFDNFC